MPRRLSADRKRRWGWCYLFIAPQLFLFVLFTIYPIVMSYVYSFFEWSGFGPLSNFIGFRNFVEIVKDSMFWEAFRNSFAYMFGLVLVQIPLALLFAILLNQKWLRGASFYRTLLFLPVVTTTAVVGLIMKFIFSSYKGLVNEALLHIGLLHHPIPWLESTDLALYVVILVGIWKSFGMNMIYWLASLQSLPQDVYEAARVDGAGLLQIFRYITIPLLVPIGTVILLLTAVNSLHMFDLVKAMTNGGPAFSTDMVDVYIYRYAFENGGQTRVGYASAAGILYGIVVMLISLVIGVFVRRTGGKEAYKF